MENTLFKEPKIDEAKRKQLKRKYNRKHRDTAAVQSRSSLIGEIQKADRITRSQEPIENYDPSKMLHALRTFRQLVSHKGRMSLADIRLHHDGIVLDGPLVLELVEFWEKLPTDFESQVTATNLNTQVRSLVDAFKEAMQRITAVIPTPITLMTLAEGMERLQELREREKTSAPKEPAKAIGIDQLAAKENFLDKLNDVEGELRKLVDKEGLIPWEKALHFDKREARIKRAHYLSHLTFIDHLRLIGNHFRIISEV